MADIYILQECWCKVLCFFLYIYTIMSRRPHIVPTFVKSHKNIALSRLVGHAEGLLAPPFAD
jgi:hypothetical protein